MIDAGNRLEAAARTADRAVADRLEALAEFRRAQPMPETASTSEDGNVDRDETVPEDDALTERYDALAAALAAQQNAPAGYRAWLATLT